MCNKRDILLLWLFLISFLLSTVLVFFLIMIEVIELDNNNDYLNSKRYIVA